MNPNDLQGFESFIEEKSAPVKKEPKDETDQEEFKEFKSFLDEEKNPAPVKTESGASLSLLGTTLAHRLWV